MFIPSPVISRELTCPLFTGRAAQTTELATSNRNLSTQWFQGFQIFLQGRHKNWMLNGTKQHKKWQGKLLPWPKYPFLWVYETDAGFVLTGCKHPNRPAFIHIKYSCGAMRKWKEWRRKLCSYILIRVKKPDKTPDLQKGCFRIDQLSFAVLFSNILSLRCCCLFLY